MITTTVTCDGCDKIIEDHSPGIQAPGGLNFGHELSGDTYPRHFCDTECIIKFITKRRTS